MPARTARISKKRRRRSGGRIRGQSIDSGMLYSVCINSIRSYLVICIVLPPLGQVLETRERLAIEGVNDDGRPEQVFWRGVSWSGALKVQCPVDSALGAD